MFGKEQRRLAAKVDDFAVYGVGQGVVQQCQRWLTADVEVFLCFQLGFALLRLLAEIVLDGLFEELAVYLAAFDNEDGRIYGRPLGTAP